MNAAMKSKPPADDGRPLAISTWLSRMGPAIDNLWSAFFRSGSAPARLLLTGVRAKDGTTTVAAGVALGLAQNLRKPVLLVEANIFRPGLARYLSASVPGFVEVCRGEVALEAVIRATDCAELDVLVAGISGDEGAGLFGSDAVARMLDQLSERYATIIIDGAPALEQPTTLLLAREAHALALVVRARVNHAERILAALARLDTAGVPIAGTILNQAPQAAPAWLEPRSPMLLAIGVTGSEAGR